MTPQGGQYQQKQKLQDYFNQEEKAQKSKFGFQSRDINEAPTPVTLTPEGMQVQNKSKEQLNALTSFLTGPRPQGMASPEEMQYIKQQAEIQLGQGKGQFIGGLSPMLNQVMGTPEKQGMIGGMGQPDIQQPMIGNMGQPDTQQPQTPYQPSQGLLLTSQQQQGQKQFPMGQPQQPPAPPQQGGAPQLIGNELWQQALSSLGQIKPYEPTTKLPTQEELGGYAKQMYEQQLGLISAPIARRQEIEKQQLAQAMADRGIPIGSEAYAREQYTLAERQAAENAQAQSQALQFGQQAAQQEHDRALAGGQFGLQEAQTRSNLARAPLESLSPLAQTQYGAGEQRFGQAQQIGSAERMQGREITSREGLSREQIASQERMQEKGLGAEAANLQTQIASNEKLAGLSSDTQIALQRMQNEGRIDLQKLTGQQQLEVIDRETKRDADLATLNKDLQLEIIQRNFDNEMGAKKFDAETQKDLLRMNLDQQDKQFVASLDMEEKKFIQQQYEFNKNLGLNEKQLEASTQLQLKQLAENRRQFDQNMLRTIQQDKFLNKLQRDQLAELITSGRRDDATKRYIADRAASGNALNADEQGNIYSARANGQIQGTIDAINAQVAAGIITPEQRDRAVQNALGVKGSGGISYTVGGK